MKYYFFFKKSDFRSCGREMQQGSAACTRGDIEAFFAPRLGE